MPHFDRAAERIRDCPRCGAKVSPRNKVMNTYTKKEIDILWDMLPFSHVVYDGEIKKSYFYEKYSTTFCTYEQLVECVSGSCYEKKIIGNDLEIRLFLNYVPLADVPLFLDSTLEIYAKWRLKIVK